MKTEDNNDNSVIPTQFDRKTIDRAMILPLLGTLLLLPPLASIFQIEFRLFGIPFTAVYLFVVWGLLIVGAALLARPLQEQAGWGKTGKDQVPRQD